MSAKARFENKFEAEPMSGCWLWTAATSPKGYGHFRAENGDVIHAHRWAYANYVSSIPHGQHVLHKCDNPACVNPSHLFVGTNADNVADKVKKKRQARGQTMPNAKITDTIADEIRKSNESSRALAARYGISHTTVVKVRNNVYWRVD